MNKENTILALREVSESNIKILVNDSDGSEIYRRAYSGIYIVDLDTIEQTNNKDEYYFDIIDAKGSRRKVKNYLTKSKYEEVHAWPYIVTVAVNKLEPFYNSKTKNYEQRFVMKTPLGVNTFEVGTPLPISEFRTGLSAHILKSDAEKRQYHSITYSNENSNNRVLVSAIHVKNNSAIEEDVFKDYKSAKVKESTVSTQEDLFNNVIFEEGNNSLIRSYIKTLKKLRYIELDENNNPINIMKTTLPICRDESKLSKLKITLKQYRESCYDKIKNDSKRNYDKIILAEAFNVHNVFGIDSFYDSEGGKHQLVYRAIDANTFNVIDNNKIYIANGDIVDYDANFIRRVNNDKA